MASASRLQVPPPQPPEAHKGRGMESISDTASKAGKAGRPVLLSFDEMPEWFQRESNQWILHGYRPISGSARASICNLFQGSKYRLFRALIFVATGLSGVTPLIHRLIIKFPNFAHKREIDSNTCVSEDKVSRKSIS
ncbi:hypothetical protein EDB81DRAFT_845461 [Dactylonectria macrodidyma]|uniref:Uncharacterized protein n=1 Tax=Dactylonectria macrodidyma TaxID=307937 RepID=A0A9P9IVT4_9HYPO|nr:hypothetical protein EDB81DRAFT_845461 [Dactylonectria macrodidyma]